MAEFSAGGGSVGPPPPPQTLPERFVDGPTPKPSDVLGLIGDILLGGEVPGTTPVSGGKKILQAVGVFGIKAAGEVPSFFFGGANKLNNNSGGQFGFSQISGGVVQAAGGAVVQGFAVITPTWDADP